MQHALATYMKDPANYENVPSFYQAKRDRFAVRHEGSRFTLLPCEGSYFQVADYSAISDEADRATSPKRVAREFGVAAIPLSPFYKDPLRTSACSASVSRSRTLPWTQPSKSYARSEGDVGTEHAPLGGCGCEPGDVRREVPAAEGDHGPDRASGDVHHRVQHAQWNWPKRWTVQPCNG